MATLKDKLLDSLGTKGKVLKVAINKLEAEKKKHEESDEEESKLAKFARIAKLGLYGFLFSMVRNIIIAIATVSGAIVLIATMLLIILLLIMMLFEAFTVLLNTDDTIPNWGRDNEAGERYEFNMQDYNLIDDMYLKNVYIQSWLLTNAKDLKSSDADVSYMLGICNYEYGPNFFMNYDKKYENYSVTEYACGSQKYGSSSTAAGLYEFMLSYPRFITEVYPQYFTDGYTVDAVWGNIPHAVELNTEVVEEVGCYPISNADFGPADTSIDRTPYNLATSVGAVICKYNQDTATTLTKDIDGISGHYYKKYYEKACEHYSIDPTDEACYTYVKNTMYYLCHAGGAWLDIDEDKYRAWAYASFDYLVYAYKNFGGMTLADGYNSLDNIKNLNIVNLKESAFGKQTTHTNSAGVAFNKDFSMTITSAFADADGNTLTKSLMEYWAKSLTGEYRDYITDFAYMYTCPTREGNRQAAYGIAVAPTMTLIGKAKLNLIWDKLGKEYVIDSQGYICNPRKTVSAETEDDSGFAVPDEYTGGDFAANLKYIGNNKTTKFSNKRDESWFVELDNTEWASPLSPTAAGGFYVSSRYGWRNFNGWDWHAGIDLATVTKYAEVDWAANCKVYSIHEGTVTKVKDYYDASGRYVTILCEYSRNGVKVKRYITYMHMSEISSNIKVGAKVAKGQQIGVMGTGGGLYAHHLHLQIGLCNPNGKYGMLDIETELPFVTGYARYKQWDNSTTSFSGYLSQRPSTTVLANTQDQQIAISPANNK